MMINLTENQCKVLAVLYYNKKAGNNFMSTKKIKEECNFEKLATTTGCLMGLKSAGLVNTENQMLLDGSIAKFFYIPDDVFNNLKFIVKFEMSDE